MRPEQITPEFLAIGFIMFGVFLFSTVCHEAAHALAAKLGGDLTAFHGGQVTLNPVPHVRREPLGMVVIPVITYMLNGWLIGWASAPYDPNWAFRHPRRAAWMALAGPAANFTLMLLAAIAIRVCMAAGIFRAPAEADFTHVAQATQSGGVAFAATFLSVLFVLNLLLGTFNLMPVPPLDGSSGIMVFMGQRRAQRYMEFISEPAFRYIGLIAVWYGFRYVFDPIFTIALNTLYPGAHYR